MPTNYQVWNVLRHLVVHHGILFIIHDLSKTEYLFFSFIIVVYVSDTEHKIENYFWFKR